MTIDTKRLRELAEAATAADDMSGPWFVGELYADVEGGGALEVCDLFVEPPGVGQILIASRCAPDDAAFIAAANPQTVIALLDALDEACDALDSWIVGHSGFTKEQRDEALASVARLREGTP